MKEKVVFLSAIQVFPPESGGQLRSANLAHSLAKLGHQVQIVSLTGRREDYLRAVPSGQVVVGEVREWVHRGKLFGALQWLSYRLKLPPFWVTYLAKFFLPKEVSQFISNAEVLILDFPFLYPLAKGGSFILNTHNAEFDLYKDRPFISKCVFNIEKKALNKTQQALFCSLSDQERFSKLEIRPNSLIVPNGVNLDTFTFNSKLRAEFRTRLNFNEHDQIFLFTGSQYLPNREAFDFLNEFVKANESFLSENHIKFLVVGTVCQEKSGQGALIIEGRVPEITPYFWASDFGLNLVDTGSGTNVKMIEYMAAKLPMLSTHFGARGLELTGEGDALLFERGDFKSVLKGAIELSISEREKMAMNSYEKNLHLLSMLDSLKGLAIKS